MRRALTSLALAGAAVLSFTGCAGSVEGAPDSVALVRGTTLADGSTLNSCLDKAGYNIRDAAALADGVEARTFGNGDEFHVVTVTSGDEQIQFTVVTERGFVHANDDASAALLDRAGCSVDGEPLNESTT
ncbi:hypothetical protein ACOCJ4_10825 [Knoellia sp. CPCC 206435]|uniref:hypothetical protein n=1 Tax=Knoellia terrae TaxID=3404797 RepID=UPI003B43179B